MLTTSLTPDRSRTLRLIRAVVVFGIAIPLLLLGALFAGGHALDVESETVVVWFTGAAVLTGALLAGWSHQKDATNPRSELFDNATGDFGGMSVGSCQPVSFPARLLFVLTGTVVIGRVLLSL